MVRISLGAFSFFVPLLTTTGFTNLALILTGFLVVSSMSEARQACRPDARG